MILEHCERQASSLELLRKPFYPLSTDARVQATWNTARV